MLLPVAPALEEPLGNDSSSDEKAVLLRCESEPLAAGDSIRAQVQVCYTCATPNIIASHQPKHLDVTAPKIILKDLRAMAQHGTFALSAVGPQHFKTQTNPWPAGHLTSHRVRIGNRNGTVGTFGPGSQGLIPRMAYFIRFQSRKGETKDKATGVDDCMELDEANTATAAAGFISWCQRREHNEGEDRESHSPTSDSDSGTDEGEESEASSSEVEQIETPPKDRAYGDPQRRLDRLIDMIRQQLPSMRIQGKGADWVRTKSGKEEIVEWRMINGQDKSQKSKAI